MTQVRSPATNSGAPNVVVQKVAFALLWLYRSVLRLLRPNSGLTFAAFNRVTNALFGLIPEKQVALVQGRLRIPVSVNDYHGRVLWLFGSNDFKVERICRQLTQPGDVFLDIGANHGSIGLAVLQAVGPQGEVHFFEPQPDLSAVIGQALQQEGSGRGHLHTVALSDGEGVLEMSLAENHSGLATIVKTGTDSPFTRTIQVATVETGRHVAGLLRGRPFGVKIDIEGAEPIVLPPLLQLPGLRFVQFEGATNIAQLQSIFSAAAFDVFGLNRTIFVPRLSHCPDLASWDLYHDFVALPRSAKLPRQTMSYAAVARHLLARNAGEAAPRRADVPLNKQGK